MTSRKNRLTRMMETVRHAVNAINVHDAFCSCRTVTSAVTKVLYYVSDLLASACKHVVTMWL